MNLIKNLLIKFVWNNDVKCMHLVLAPEWVKGEPYGFNIKKWSNYIKEHDITDEDTVTKEIIGDMYFKRKEFCGLVKGAYIARDSKEVENLYKELGQIEKIVPFKVAPLTKVAIHYDIDKMYWEMQMPFQKNSKKFYKRY